MKLSAPRYSSGLFPSYAFLPGTDPHPTADVRGHSYRRTSEHCAQGLGTEWRANRCYLYGCDLFNYGYWWEAHEAWEAIWLQLPRGGGDASFLQMLIQAANALLKQRMGRRRAALRLQTLVIELATGLEDEHMGLEVRPWLAEFSSYLTSQGESGLGENGFPYLVLKHS